MKIAELASRFSADDFVLSKSLQVEENEKELRDRVMHMVLDFRMEYVEEHLRDLQQKLKSVAQDVEAALNVMKEIKRMQQIRNLLAKELGNDILV